MRVEGTGHDTKIFERCFTCGGEFRYGPQRYDGRAINRYDIAVCRACYEGNWDGWAPHYEEKLVAHLDEKGIPHPKRNDKGWWPRD